MRFSEYNYEDNTVRVETTVPHGKAATVAITNLTDNTLYFNLHDGIGLGSYERSVTDWLWEYWQCKSAYFESADGFFIQPHQTYSMQCHGDLVLIRSKEVLSTIRNYPATANIDLRRYVDMLCGLLDTLSYSTKEQKDREKYAELWRKVQTIGSEIDEYQKILTDDDAELPF